MLAAKRRKFLRFENVDPCLDTPRAPRFFHCGSRGIAESKEDEKAY
jgi:hypothetical protein